MKKKRCGLRCFWLLDSGDACIGEGVIFLYSKSWNIGRSLALDL